MHMFHDALVSFAERRVICMKELSKTLTGKKIRDEMLKRKMTVRDLQDALELDSPQSIYKWLRGESLPSLPNMLVLGELFKVPLERLLVHEDGSVAYHRIFDDSLPYEIAYLVQDKDDFSAKRRHVARADTFAGTCYSGIFNLPQECPHSKAPHN